MGKYCSAGKIECENYQKQINDIEELCKIEYIDNDVPMTEGLGLTNFEVCPWPSRQVPVEPERELGKNKLIYDKATKTIMCNGKTVVNMKGLNQVPVNNIATPKPRIINGLYIVDETPVEALPERENFLREQYLIFERAGYERGRFEMKREIGVAVENVSHWDESGKGDFLCEYSEIIAAIEGVK